MANKKLFLIPRVRDYLLDGTIHDRLEEIAAKYKIPEGRSEEFLDLTDAVMNGKIEISKMPQFIAQAFAVDEVTSKKIASDLAGYRLLPLEDFIPGVSAQIKAWGGIISDYPELRIEREKYTTEKLLEDYAKEIGLQLPDYIMKRFVFLAKGYLTKERARAATKTLMMRSLNIGGLELTDEQAEGVFKKLDQVDLSKAEDGHVSDIARNSAELNNEAILANRLPRSIEEDVLPPPLPPPLPIPAPQKVVKKEDATPPPTLPIEKPGKSRFGAKQAVASPKKKDFLSVLSTKTALTKEVPVISGSLIDESEEREVKDQAVKLEKKLKQVNDLSRGLASQTPVIVTDKVVEIFKATRQSKKSAVDFVDKYLRGMLDKHRALALLEDKYGLHIDQVNKVVDILDIAKQEQDISLKSKIVERDAKKVGAYDIDKNEKEVLELRHAALTKSMPTQASETVVTGARVSAARSKEEEIELQKSKIDPEKIAVAPEEIDKAIATAKDEKEKKALESQKYFLASMLRQQKTLDFLSNLL